MAQRSETDAMIEAAAYDLDADAVDVTLSDEAVARTDASGYPVLIGYAEDSNPAGSNSRL